MNYTKFIRTSDTDHIKISGYIWQQLSKDIYKGKYVGMYDQKEEEFISLNESELIKKEDPERFKRLQRLEEENYYFKLSKYGQKIRKAIENGEMEIVPQTRKNEITALLDRGLDDLSISRPKEKIPWGISVPGDSSQTMYVWVEALMNYITTLNYPEGAKFKKYWPCDVHVVGKDIIRFHAAIWPAMLMSLGLELPKTIYAHGFINVSGAKMSKSVGNVVAPLDIVKDYGSEAFRYFFARHIPSVEDGDFTWEKFENSYNTELGNELGNLVQRVASMINRYQDGVIGNVPESAHDTGPYHDHILHFRFDRALDYVWSLLKGMNQYIEIEKTVGLG